MEIIQDYSNFSKWTDKIKGGGAIYMFTIIIG